MRKLLILAAALGLLVGAQPAGAEAVAANVTGGLDLDFAAECDADGDGVLETEEEVAAGRTTSTDDEGSYTATFTGVTITGTFETNNGAYAGQVSTPGIAACVLPTLAQDVFGNNVPVLSTGQILGGGFGTPGTSAGVYSDGDLACLDGTITGGSFETTGIVARAIFDLEWTVYRPAGATCNLGSAGTLGSADNQPVIADVVALPLGNAIPGTPSVVTGLVHTAGA